VLRGAFPVISTAAISKEQAEGGFPPLAIERILSSRLSDEERKNGISAVPAYPTNVCEISFAPDDDTSRLMHIQSASDIRKKFKSFAVSTSRCSVIAASG
jgi:hypothetical protein